jgi:hypothetical protein
MGWRASARAAPTRRHAPVRRALTRPAAPLPRLPLPLSPPSPDVANFSEQQLARLKYVPELPPALQRPAAAVAAAADTTTPRSASDVANLKTWFPHTYGGSLVNLVAGGSAGVAAAGAGGARALSAAPLRVGVVFAGRQSPGGHNVVSGLYDFLTALNPGSTLLGFISGTKGLFEQQCIPITAEALVTYRNQVRGRGRRLGLRGRAGHQSACWRAGGRACRSPSPFISIPLPLH